MRLSISERRTAFPAAIRLAGYKSVATWAKANDVATTSAYHVARGERISRETEIKIDTFTLTTLVSYADNLRLRMRSKPLPTDTELPPPPRRIRRTAA